MPEFGYGDRDGMTSRSYRQNDFREGVELEHDANRVYAPKHIRKIMDTPARKRTTPQKRTLKKWRESRKLQAKKDAQVSRNQVNAHNRSWAGKVRSESDDKRAEYRHVGVTTGGNQVANTSRTGVEMIFWASDQHNDADRAARVASMPSNGRCDEFAGMPGVVDIRTTYDGAAGKWLVTDDARARVKSVGANGTHTTRHSHASDCNYGNECTRDERVDVPELDRYVKVDQGTDGDGRAVNNYLVSRERRDAVENARRVNGAYTTPRGICESDFPARKPIEWMPNGKGV